MSTNRRPIVHVSPDYLVSQIEMDEILNNIKSKTSRNESSDDEDWVEYYNFTGSSRNSSAAKLIETYGNGAEKSSNLTDHRLPMREFSRRSSKVASHYNYSDSENERIEKESEPTKSRINSGVEIRKTRTPCSIPTRSNLSNYDRESRSGETKSPALLVEYKILEFPEKYLLPIRFPVMYSNIIKKLLKQNYLLRDGCRSAKLVTQRDNGQKYLLYLA